MFRHIRGCWNTKFFKYGSRRWITNDQKDKVGKITIVGASNRMSQFLALLLKQSQNISEITLFDRINFPGVALDLNHIDTKCKLRSYHGRAMLKSSLKNSEVVVLTHGWDHLKESDENAYLRNHAHVIFEYALDIAFSCPEAVICLLTPPVNMLLPLFCEVMKKCNMYNPRKIVGFCSLTEMRSNTLLGDYLYLDPASVRVPVIGGNSFHTSVPLFSQAIPFPITDEQTIHDLTTELLEMNDSCRSRHTVAPLSSAYAAARLVQTVVHGLCGHENAIAPAYVRADIMPQVKFFANQVKFGRNGIELNYGIPKLTDYELKMTENAISALKKEIEFGMCFYEEINHQRYEVQKPCIERPVLLKTPKEPIAVPLSETCHVCVPKVSESCSCLSKN